MLPRDRGRDRAGRLGAGVPRHPAAERVLRGEARDPGLHRSLRTELLHDKSNVRVTMVQLPAVNTPQFDWVLSRLPRRPQPVPPIYQPEVVARGDRVRGRPPAAARVLGGRRRRSATLIGDKFARRPARPLPRPAPASTPSRPTSRSRRTPGEPLGARRRPGRPRPRRPRPVRRPGDVRSPQLWASRHHGLLGAAARAGGGGRRRRRSAPPSSAAADPRVGTFAAASRHVAVASRHVRQSR